MNWTKIPTNLLISRTPDNELVAIVKYQLLWADLEYQPTDEIALRYMTNKQLASVKHYLNDIEAQVVSDIKSTINHRGNQKMFYQKKQLLKQNADSQYDSQYDDKSDSNTDGADKIRLDKIRKEKELSSDNSKKKVCEETVFNAGFQNWRFDPMLLKIAKKHWTADTIRKIEIDFSCQEYNTETSIQELLERYPADKDKAVLPKNLGQYEYMRPQMQKWIDYKKSRGEKYKTEQSLMVCAKKLHELSGGNALNADAIVEQSIASNYAGLFPLKQNASPNMPRMSLKEMKEMQNDLEIQKILRGER